MHPPLAVQDVRPRPGHLLEHHQPQRPARHVHTVAHRVGAQQAAFFLGAEDVDQRGVVHRIDVLRIQRDPRRLQLRRDPRVHRPQPPYRGEQSQPAATRRHEQRPICRGQRADVPRRHIRHDQRPGLRRVVERTRHRHADRRRGQMRRAHPRLRRLPRDLGVRLAGIPQRRRGHQQPVRRRRQAQRKRHRRIEPMPVQPDVPIARLPPIQPQEHHVLRPLPRLTRTLRRRAQHPPPCRQRIDRPPPERAARRLDPHPRGGVHLLRLVLQPRRQPGAQRLQRLDDPP